MILLIAVFLVLKVQVLDFLVLALFKKGYFVSISEPVILVSPHQKELFLLQNCFRDIGRIAALFVLLLLGPRLVAFRPGDVVFVFLERVCEADSVLAATDPGRFRHRRVDLFQIKFFLDVLFVHVRDHVRRLYERHRKGRPHQQLRALAPDLQRHERE